MLRLATAAGLLAVASCEWTPINNLQPDESVRFHLSLHHKAEDELKLYEFFHAVSTPGNPQHGKYLTQEELREMIPPATEAVDTANAWCSENRLECAPVGTGDVLQVKAHSAFIESAFNVKLQRFKHSMNLTKQTIVRTNDAITLPENVAAFASAISGLETFPILPKPIQSKSGSPAVTPQTLKTLYNITGTASTDKGGMAVAEFQGQAYLPKDLAQFESTYNLASMPVRTVIGGPDATSSAGVEASLDIQYIIATGPGVPADFYLHNGSAFDLMGFTTTVLGLTNPALVWSVSYGEGVNGGNGGVIQPSYAQSLNLEFVKFAAKGMTVFVASGDSGVYNRLPFEHSKFHPSFPACLPAVTAVGATQLQEDGSETTGVSFSGGGFTPAAYFTRAANSTWQSDAVNAYLNNPSVKLPPADLWDRTGRGLPDVSAVGVDFDVVVDARIQGVSGTSASTPAVAGIFALINSKLLEAGKPPLGFINPFIYKNPSAFRDILLGYNDGGGISIFKKGFYAAKGWDPVTGLGTPNYEALEKAAMAMFN